MGLLDFYRVRKPETDESAAIDEEPEEELESLPKLSLSEFWPPSPRVKLLYIGMMFALINLVLLCVWAFVLINQLG